MLVLLQLLLLLLMLILLLLLMLLQLLCLLTFWLLLRQALTEKRDGQKDTQTKTELSTVTVHMEGKTPFSLTSHLSV